MLIHKENFITKWQRKLPASHALVNFHHQVTLLAAKANKLFPMNISSKGFSSLRYRSQTCKKVYGPDQYFDAHFYFRFSPKLKVG